MNELKHDSRVCEAQRAEIVGELGSFVLIKVGTISETTTCFNQGVIEIS
jgi:hypothetical protein